MNIKVFYNQKGILMMNKRIFPTKDYFLFQKDSSQMTGVKKFQYEAVNFLLIVLAPIFLGGLSLLLSYGNYGCKIFLGYFFNPLIAVLNLIPPLLLMLFLYGIIGKGWIAFAIDAFVVLGLTTVNFYLLRFRDDPVMFSDILLIREATDMGTKYDLVPGFRIVFCWLAVIFVTLFLFFFQRKRVKFLFRIWLVPVVVLLCMYPLKSLYTDSSVYNAKTQNFKYINRWSATQLYISKGFIYPFIYSIGEAFPSPPEGYSVEKAQSLIGEFEDADIPDEKKVNVVAVMLEAFSDLTDIGIVEGVSPEVYADYYELLEESYHGTLLTNIFAGGTIDSERAFLTGYSTLSNYRKNVNSHVRYLKGQGYYAEGSHPCYAWFYNRRNINRYFGFDNYYFYEDYYSKITPGVISKDYVVFPEILKLYFAGTEKDEPYFGFHVTYQGHGPYPSDRLEWSNEKLYNNPNVSEQSENILNNYFGSVRNTAENVKNMLNVLRDDDEPCVVLVFGDHKPWLGDGNSVYNELGVDLRVSGEQGYLNYYSTEYLFWANDKAKQVLGNDFKGEGETISTNFLMNKLFELCSWPSSAYMQYTDKIRKNLPVISIAGFYNTNREFVPSYAGHLTSEEYQALKDFRIAEYYMSSFCE